MVRFCRHKALVFALTLLISAPAAAAQEGEWSRAQTLLFDTPHLENVTTPRTLTYEFRQRGDGGTGFEDKVDLIVTEILPDGRRNLEFRFLSGERQRVFQPISGFRGNPLVMLFLQWDVEQMKEATGGSARYFRNRIRYAFHDRAELEEVEIDLAGRALAATRVTIRPFADDPQRERFPDYGQKYYEFLMTPEVPGGIYRIKAVTPAAEGEAPRQEESVTFSGKGT